MELPSLVLKPNNAPNASQVTLSDTNLKTTPKNEEMARRKALRREIDRLISNSTINGLSQAFSTEKRNYRIFWFCLFFIGLVGFGINLYHIVDSYVQAPILTQMEKQYTPFQWPHFTICNPMNPIPFWKSPKLVKKWKSLYDKAESYKLPKYGIRTKEVRPRAIWGHDIAMTSLNPQVFYRHGIRGNVFMVSIKHWETCIGTSSGGPDNFHRIFRLEKIFQTTMHSSRAPVPCYTLEAERLARALGKETLQDELLTIKIYILMDFKSHKIFNPAYESRKVHFFISHPNTTLQSTTPTFILAGTLNYFEMKQKTHKHITECRKKEFEVDMYDSTMQKSRKLVGDYDDCRMHLSQEIYFKKCNCYNPNLPLYKFGDELPRLCTNTSVYNNSEMTKNIQCLNQVIQMDANNKKFRQDLAKKCDYYRHPRCINSRYIVTRTTDVWKDDMSDYRRLRLRKGMSSIPNAPKNATEDFSRKNLAIVTLSWNRQPTEVTYEQYEYPTSKLCSDIGGIAGLWIGLSVISVFEIMELLFVSARSVMV